MAKLLTVDLLATLGAGAWAVTAHLWLPELAELVSVEAAGAFALLAAGRWYHGQRRRKKTDLEVEQK